MEPEDELLIRSLNKRFDALTGFTPVLRDAAMLEQWHRNMLGVIMLRSRANFYHLRESIRGTSLELTAWASRNLLELLVWALYVTQSKENAHRLFDDQVNDAADFAKAFVSFVKTLKSNVDVSALEGHDELLKQVRASSSLQDDDGYLVVGKVAKLVDIAGTFYSLNRLLSKLAHPTALSLLLNLQPNQERDLRTFLLRAGLMCAKDVLDVVGGYCKQCGIATLDIEDPVLTYEYTFRPSRT